MAPASAPTAIPSDNSSPALQSGLQSQSSQAIICIIFGLAMFLLAVLTMIRKSKAKQGWRTASHLSMKVIVPTSRENSYLGRGIPDSPIRYLQYFYPRGGKLLLAVLLKCALSSWKPQSIDRFGNVTTPTFGMRDSCIFFLRYLSRSISKTAKESARNCALPTNVVPNKAGINIGAIDSCTWAPTKIYLSINESEFPATQF